MARPKKECKLERVVLYVKPELKKKIEIDKGSIISLIENHLLNAVIIGENMINCVPCVVKANKTIKRMQKTKKTNQCQTFFK